MTPSQARSIRHLGLVTLSLVRIDFVLGKLSRSNLVREQYVQLFISAASSFGQAKVSPHRTSDAQAAEEEPGPIKVT